MTTTVTNKALEDAIFRLRTTKQEFVTSEMAIGRDDGYTWAQDDAEYGDLIRLSKIDTENFERDDGASAPDLIASAIACYEPYEIFGDRFSDLSYPYFWGFVEGAQTFFHEVKARL